MNLANASIGILFVAMSLSGSTAEAAPSLTFVRWGDSYGGSGGYYFNANCAPGSVAVGLRGYSGGLIDRMGLICAPVLSSGALGSAYEVASVGGNGGGAFSLQCASGYAISAIYGRTGGNFIDAIGIRCRTLNYAYYHDAGSTGGTSGYYFGDAQLSGQFVTSIAGKSEFYINRIQAGYSLISW